MQATTPIVTDNIHKFQATLGLWLMISGLLGAVLAGHVAIDRFNSIISEVVDAETQRGESDSDHEKIAMSQVQMIASVLNAQTKAGYLICCFGFGLMCYGIWHWADEVQPIETRIRKAQMLIAEREAGISEAADESCSDVSE